MAIAQLPPLATAVAVCRERDLCALTHVVESVSAFLDTAFPCFWTVPRACALGSLRLAQRVHARQEQQVESDEYYHAFLFRGALVSAVEHDDLRMVQWLCTEYCPWGFASLAVERGVELGRLTIVQWLAANHANILWNPRFVDQADARCADLAARNGHLSMLQWLETHAASGGCSVNTMSEAARNGHLEVVKWLHHQGAGSISALRSAIRGGHLAIAQFLFEHKYDTRHIRGDSGIDDAARSGDLDVVVWLHATGITSCSPQAMDAAASNGNLGIVQWLHEHRREGCTIAAMDSAASNGHFHVVQWLHANRSEGCSTAAMDGAASNGHLDIVQWLHEHRTEGCTEGAIDGAAGRGHLDVVQWLVQHRGASCTERAMRGAIAHGHLDVLRWLSGHCSLFTSHEAPTWRRLCASNVGDLAAGGGHLSVVQWLDANGLDAFSRDAIVAAARGNHLGVVQWLHAHRSDGATSDAMDEAASRAVVQWLHEHRTEGCTPAAMDNAVASGDFETVLFLHEHVHVGCSPKVSRSIRNFGDHIELWLWLYAHYRERLDIYDIHWRFYERDDLRALLTKLGL